MNKLFILILGFITCLDCMALSENVTSGLDNKSFNKFWKVESESPDYRLSFNGDTCEILSPKGLTLWRKEKISGDVVIEYDACVVYNGAEGERLSDLNCFWMASDSKYPNNIFKREEWRKGIFLNCYTLEMYYLGYGGNYNSTTRFRRYTGDERGVNQANFRPSILKEYKDPDNLLVANKWYHIKLVSKGNRVQYYIDGKLLVDFVDVNPLKSGWFGFRTTLSKTRITNFKYTRIVENSDKMPLHWVGDVPFESAGVSFGVPFSMGELKTTDGIMLKTKNGEPLLADSWINAYWPDGSVKWIGVSAYIPGKSDSLYVVVDDKPNRETKKKIKELEESVKPVNVSETNKQFIISNDIIKAYIPKNGALVLDSLYRKGIKVGGNADLLLTTQSDPDITKSDIEQYVTSVNNVSLESVNTVRTLVKIEGVHKNDDGKQLLPFVLRMYFYRGSEQIKMVHSFIYDGDQNKDFIRSLGLRFSVPMRDELYNRHVAFSCGDNGVWSEPVKPLVGRRVLTLNGDNTLQKQQMEGKRIPEYDKFDSKNQNLINNWASWDGYRLNQLTDNSFSVRKRATSDSPWIGTFTGERSNGYVFAGGTSGGIGVSLKDFWQSYPTSLEVNGARSDEASIIIWLWSPESECMDLRHYDKVAHDLNASYEDVQEGMSTPYGISRTHTITLIAHEKYPGKAGIADYAQVCSEDSKLFCTPEYLHKKKAFGIWSLPDYSNEQRAKVENRLNQYLDIYKKAVEQHKWYGFWNYGDVMHAYDPIRHMWRYDVGGYAWDNTELASNMWLWYSFLRTGRKDIWNMAEAMTRHNSEVDVYHIGDNAGLGSRHNVSHWGCGAKEARISQAAWNRFYYYLTTDERIGDLMTEVKDCDQKLYTLDPMRLAEPREKFPCSAPARLRIGPDWLAYAGNWMTEWERTKDLKYRDKIIAGMESISKLPNGLFTGNLALGFDPATGIISYDGNPNKMNTNHLMTIMGGFEVMNELMMMIDMPDFEKCWLEHAVNYKNNALKISRNKFRVVRLMAYAAWHNYNPELSAQAWDDLWNRNEHREAPEFKVNIIETPEVPYDIYECPTISTNDAALWSLDAIYMLETIPQY